MNIVVPTNDKKGLDANIAEHFGRCNTYTFINSEGRIIKIIDNTSEHMGGTGLPPELMKKNGADVLLCRELGPRALDLCKKIKIMVYVGDANTVKEIFNKWKNGKLKEASSEDICKEHKL